MFSDYYSISALSCSLWLEAGGGGGGSHRLLSLNQTTILVVLLLGLWLLLGCDNFRIQFENWKVYQCSCFLQNYKYNNMLQSSISVLKSINSSMLISKQVAIFVLQFTGNILHLLQQNLNWNWAWSSQKERCLEQTLKNLILIFNVCCLVQT